MVDVYDYLDYRKYLRDSYLERQSGNAKLTHRDIGNLGGFDPGLFSKVLFGQRNISRKLIPGFCIAFGLKGREAAFFANLVLFNQALTFDKKQVFFKKLLASDGGKIAPVARSQYEFYSKWQHTAIRELLHYFPFAGDYKELGRQLSPPIGARPARQSVALLERLGMIRKTTDGKFELTSTQISSGLETRSVQIDNFIQQCIELAMAGLKRIPGNKRNYSTLTFSVPRDKIPEMEDRIRTFRRELSDWVSKQGSQDSVYQLNLQLFPMTRPAGGKRNA